MQSLARTAMAYERKLLAESVHTLLRHNPRLTLAQLAIDMRVDRHTISRTLTEHFGVSFRALQGQCVAKRAEEIRSKGTRSVKEVAHELGYNSAKAFARRLQRVQRAAR